MGGEPSVEHKAVEEPQRSSARRVAANQVPPWKDTDPERHPKHRIFLSIDAIGSTKLKSSLADKGCTPDVWANSFMAFLPEVEVVYWNKFVEAVNRHCSTDTCASKCVPNVSGRRAPPEQFNRAKVWKYIGDEVVLVSELTCPKLHPALHVLALAETIRKFNRDFAAQPILNDEDNLLQFKGTAWVAGFPVTNIEVILPSLQGDVPDYLGPSIDLGFRLSKFASQERLVLSASLAHLIVSGSYLNQSVHYMGANTPAVPLCFAGSVEAKGIKNGKHPLIWHPVIETEESKLCRVTNDDLMGFFQNDHFKDMLVAPFILGTAYSDPNYYAAYKKAVAQQKKVPNSIFYPARRIAKKPKQTGTLPTALDAKKVIDRLPKANRDEEK